jgi:hypothetical protein
MSYSNSGLSLIAQGVGGGPSVFIYTSADAHTDVDASGYFSDGAKFGLKANDVVIVIDTNTPTTTIHSASSATTIRSATLA